MEQKKEKILKKIQSSGFVGNGAENEYFYHAKNKFFEFNYKLPNKWKAFSDFQKLFTNRYT